MRGSGVALSVAACSAVVIAAGVYLAVGSNGSPRTADLSAHVPFSNSPAASWRAATVALTMPKAVAEGPYPAAEVAGALARARAYLIATHTSSAVLESHDLSAPQALVSAGIPATIKNLYAIELAPGNTLAAPPRLTGNVQDSFVPRTSTDAEHLEVTTNLIWAYALRANYPVYVDSDGVVTLHEHMTLDFYLDAAQGGPSAKVTPTRDQALQVNGDCGYFDQYLIGLPRVHDPERVGTGAPTSTGGPEYNVGATVTGSSGCR